MLHSIRKAVVLGALVAAVPLAAHADIFNFDVYARENSLAVQTNDATPLNTGLSFAAGDAIDITATGSWNGGGCGVFTADGTNCFGNDSVTGINFFSLIGKIGSNDDADNTWFKIGTSYTGVAASSGTLYLAFLDNDSFNNSGFVTASVTAVPEASTWAMMLGGMAGLVAVTRRRRAPAA